MRHTLIVLALLSWSAPPAFAQTSRSVADVVLEDARTITEGDGAGLLALFDEDSLIYATPQDPDRLDGPLAKTMGTHAERIDSFPRIADSGPVRLEVAEMITAGNMAVSKNIFTAPNGRQAFNLVIYRVRDGIISDLWHPSRTPILEPARGTSTQAVVEQVLDALNKGEDAVRALLHPEVRFYESSGAAHAVGDKLLASASQTPERELRRLFGADMLQLTLEDVIVFNEYLAGRYAAETSNGLKSEGIVIFRVIDGSLRQAWRI